MAHFKKEDSSTTPWGQSSPSFLLDNAIARVLGEPKSSNRPRVLFFTGFSCTGKSSTALYLRSKGLRVTDLDAFGLHSEDADGSNRWNICAGSAMGIIRDGDVIFGICGNFIDVIRALSEQFDVYVVALVPTSINWFLRAQGKRGTVEQVSYMRLFGVIASTFDSSHVKWVAAVAPTTFLLKDISTELMLNNVNGAAQFTLGFKASGTPFFLKKNLEVFQAFGGLTHEQYFGFSNRLFKATDAKVKRPTWNKKPLDQP